LFLIEDITINKNVEVSIVCQMKHDIDVIDEKISDPNAISSWTSIYLRNIQRYTKLKNRSKYCNGLKRNKRLSIKLINKQ